MAFFRANPEKILQRDIDLARSNLSRLTATLTESKQAIIERKAAAQAFARDGADDDVLSKAEVAIRKAQDRAESIGGALIAVKEQLAALEKDQADQVDATTRRQTAAEVEQMAIDLESIGQEIIPVVERMIAVCDRAVTGQIWDSVGLQAYASASRSQIPAAVEMVARALRAHAALVLNHQARATLLKPGPPVVEAVATTVLPPKDHFTYSAMTHAPVYRGR